MDSETQRTFRISGPFVVTPPLEPSLTPRAVAALSPRDGIEQGTAVSLAFITEGSPEPVATRQHHCLHLDCCLPTPRTLLGCELQDCPASKEARAALQAPGALSLWVAESIPHGALSSANSASP
jgi:hypothetical protein